MKISEVEAAQNQTFQKAASSPPPNQNQKNRRHPASDKTGSQSDPVVLNTQGGGHAIRKLENVNTVMNRMARSIRVADDAMDEIGKTLKKMKSGLVGLIKQFPPYPPGSEERVKSLKTFAALRRQIDALSFPPDEGAQAILSGNGPDTSARVDLGTDDIHVSMNRQSVHTGPGGLDIPDLPENADDDALRNALDHIDRAFGTLGQRKDNLAKDVERFIRL